MISVVIPMYNSNKSIINAVKSVINQTAFDYVKEIIIVDDGSTDNSNQIVQDFINKNPKSRIKLYNKQNGGVSSARNYGIKKSSEKWIALLDSDDVWLRDKLEKQIEVINNHSDIVFIGGGRNKEHVKIGKQVEDGLYKLTTKDLLKKYWPHTSTALIRKDILISVGLYDESRKYAEDGQLWLKISSKYDLFYIKEDLEIAGENKRSFGEKGLSANLVEMYQGVLRNIDEVYDRNEIKYVEMITYKFLEWIKYIRRIIITRYF